MTPENVRNASIDTLAMQQTTTADRAPPHAGTDTTATPMAANGLDKRYDGQPALDHVSLQLEPGTVLVLIGRNGAGKTTLIRTLLVLVEPDAGSASIWGRPALQMDDAAKGRLSYVPQQPEALAWLKVGDLLDFIGRFYPRWDAARSEERRVGTGGVRTLRSGWAPV